MQAERLIDKYLGEAVTVSTSEFENSHGKKPRGSGNWMFGFGNKPNAEDETLSQLGAYPQALSKAKSYAVTKNWTHLKVMP